MKNASFVFVSAVMIAAATFSGCKKASEKLTDKIIEKSLKNSGASDAKVDVSKGKVKFKTDKGEMEMSTGDSVSLPADFPKDIYVIKGAKIQTAMKTPEGHMLQMSVAQAKEKIAETYESEMKSQGWTSDASLDMGEACTRSFKKDNRQVVVIASQTDSGSELMITTTSEKQ